MRAAMTQGRGEPLVVGEVPDPSPEPDQLLVRVEACGVCGSDLHIADSMDSPGRVLGHEFAGEIVAVGSATSGHDEGEHIAVFPLIGCGTCLACITGRPSRCTAYQLVGGGLSGAYAEYVAINARQAFRLPEGVDARAGALVEPLAVALHAWRKTPAEDGEPVLILGGGPVGQALALWAKHFGARDVIVSDPVAHRRELAERAGASGSIDPRSSDVAGAFEELTGLPPRVVIECVGVPGMIQQALDLAIADGHVTVVGMCLGPDEIVPRLAMRKELSTQFVLFYREDDYGLTIRSLERGALDFQPLITDVVSLDELPDRFEALKHPTMECKVLVEPTHSPA